MSEEQAELYVNQVSLTIGPYDVVLDFGLQSRAATPDEKPSTTSLVRVRMSHSHAKVMTKLLAKNLNEYEDKHGKIMVPKEIYDELGIREW